MPTSNEKILDSYIRHQTFLLRYSGGLRNQMLAILANTEKRVRDTVLSYIEKSPGRVLAGAAGRKWNSDFRKALQEARLPAWAEVTDDLDSQLKQLAIDEAAQGASVIQGAVPSALNLTQPPAQQLISIVNSQPFEGRTLKQWVRRTSAADVQRMLNLSKIGITNGLTPTQVARSVIGTKSARYWDGAMRKSYRDLEAVILTVTNGIQQEAKQALYEQNSDVITKEIYTATLDARTTLICASNDNKIFPRGEGPIPPLHFRCRSLRVPYIDPNLMQVRPFNPTIEKQLLREYANEANIGSVASRGALPYGHKTSFDKFARKRKRQLIGQVPAGLSYNDWLKNQSREFQDQVLGSTRAEIFRQGGVSLDKFVARDGDTLTLDELRRKGIEAPDSD